MKNEKKDCLAELPVPKDRAGYTKAEILAICRDRGIHHRTFWKAFGVNTATLAPDGTLRYYPCDVERALCILGKPGGKFHLWD